jgi:[ribosomal protein S5]-alanine N-acetyltransferase
MEPLVFETPRLIALRRFVVADASEALAMYSDAEVVRYIGNQRVPDVDTMRERITLWRDKYARYGEAMVGPFPVREKSSGALVGTALLKYLPAADESGQLRDTPDLEIGWHFARSAWGQGYASETGRALLMLGFQHHDCSLLHAVVEPANPRSMAVARRIGMRHTGQTARYYGLTLEHFELERAAVAP